MSEKGKKNKKKTGLGLAIWILTFLIILIVFLVKQEEIKSNFEKSGASALIEKKLGKESTESKKSEDSNEIVIDLTKNLKKSEPVAKSEPKKNETAEKTETPTMDSLKSKSDSEEKMVQVPKSEEKKTEVTLKQEEKTTQTVSNQSATAQSPQSQTQQNTQTQSTVKTQTPSETKTVTQSPANAIQTPPATNMAKAKICFVAIDSDGPVVRKEVTRSVHKDSPMGDALNLLLAGPNSTEEKTGCRSLIPSGTRLLGATIKNGIATLNFSEEFQFNQFGAEGSLAQLMQVVYTATNFSTVKSVQILIEGQKRDYLTEGVWIGSPLNRNSF